MKNDNILFIGMDTLNEFTEVANSLAWRPHLFRSYPNGAYLRIIELDKSLYTMTAFVIPSSFPPSIKSGAGSPHTKTMAKCVTAKN